MITKIRSGHNYTDALNEIIRQLKQMNVYLKALADA